MSFYLVYLLAHVPVLCGLLGVAWYCHIEQLEWYSRNLAILDFDRYWKEFELS